MRRYLWKLRILRVAVRVDVWRMMRDLCRAAGRDGLALWCVGRQQVAVERLEDEFKLAHRALNP